MANLSRVKMNAARNVMEVGEIKDQIPKIENEIEIVIRKYFSNLLFWFPIYFCQSDVRDTEFLDGISCMSHFLGSFFMQFYTAYKGYNN